MEWQGLGPLLDDVFGVDWGADETLSTLDGAYEWLFKDIQLKIDQGWPEWLGQTALDEINELILDEEPETALELYVSWGVIAEPFLRDAVIMMGEDPDLISPSIADYEEIILAKANSAAFTEQQKEVGSITSILRGTITESWEDFKQGMEGLKPENWPLWAQIGAVVVALFAVHKVLK